MVIATSWLDEVDLVEAVDRGLHVDDHGIHVGDHVADHVLPLREAGGHRGRRLRGDRRHACVDRQAERDDPLSGEVGAVLSVGDERVEQLVDRDEVRAAHVPVRLLAVDGQRLQAEHDGREELGGSGSSGRVCGGRGGGLRLGHLRLHVGRIACRPARLRLSVFNGTQPPCIPQARQGSANQARVTAPVGARIQRASG